MPQYEEICRFNMDPKNKSLHPSTPAICNICDWRGKLSDCEIEIDSEGWEYPEYEVLICPACGEGDVSV